MFRALVLTAFTLAAQATWAIMDFSYLETDLTGPGEEHYSVVIVRNTTHSVLAPDSYAREHEAKRMAAEGQNWAFEKFAEHYPGYSKEDLEKLKKQYSLEDPRMSRFVIYTGGIQGPHSKIVGHLVMVHDDRKTNLPMDNVFGRISREIPKFKMYPNFGGLFEGGIYENMELTGGLVQMMEFITTKKDLNAILHLLALADQQTGAGDRLPWVAVPEEFRPEGVGKPAALYRNRKRTGLVQKPVPAPEGDLFELKPSTYVLYCDERMVAYYESLGFKVHREKGRLRDMRISHRDFIEIPVRSRLFAPAHKKIQERHGLVYFTRTVTHPDQATAWPILPVSTGVKSRSAGQELDFWRPWPFKFDLHPFDESSMKVWRCKMSMKGSS